jgi:Ca2+-binding EF-hand superfamily protein
MLKTRNNTLLRLSLMISLIALGAISLSGAVDAIPQMMQKRMSSKFKAADKNADGELSLSEAQAGGLPDPVLKQFNLIDVNNSRTISLKELIAAFDNKAIKR